MEVVTKIAPICLALIMLGLGTGLTIQDFTRVIKHPKDFAVGLICQLILLPIVAFTLIKIFNTPTELALGVMLIAAAPGGVTSNILTKFANGDVALSVSLTAIISFISIISVPLIVFVSADLLNVSDITKDLSKILNIDMIKAEKIKLCFDKNEKFLIEKNLSLDLVRKIIFARIEEILELCIQSIKLNHNLDQTYQFQLILMGDGSKILDNKFKEKIVFSKEIDLLEETPQDICEAALKLSEGINKQEVVIIPKKQMKIGFFEKLFHFFK